MALMNCPDCGTEVSSNAAACPKCARPIAAGSSPAPTWQAAAAPAKSSGFLDPKQNLRSLGQVLVLLIVLGGAGAVFYYKFAPRETKDQINRIASGTGITVTPWVDRADTALRRMMGDPSNQRNIGDSIRGICHPTGTFEKVNQWVAEKRGSEIVLTLDVNWKGGFVGTEYTTRVQWRCLETGPVGVQVLADNSTFVPGAEAVRKLGEYFESGVWPALSKNAGG